MPKNGKMPNLTPNMLKAGKVPKLPDVPKNMMPVVLPNGMLVMMVMDPKGGKGGKTGMMPLPKSLEKGLSPRGKPGALPAITPRGQVPAKAGGRR